MFLQAQRQHPQVEEDIEMNSEDSDVVGKFKLRFSSMTFSNELVCSVPGSSTGKERGGFTCEDAMAQYKLSLEAKNNAMKRKIDKSIAICKKHVEDFNQLRKCLEIILDMKLFNLAITDSAVVWKVTNDFAHANYNVDNSSFYEMLGRI